MVFGSITDFGSGFGVGGSPPPEYGGGADELWQCWHYQLKYTIDLSHSYIRTDTYVGRIYEEFDDLDYEGEVTIKAKLKRGKVDRKCIIGAPDPPPDKKCKLCFDRYFKGARDFYVMAGPQPGNWTMEWDDLSKEYIGLACPAPEISLNIYETRGHYGFSCQKDWFQCGKNKRLEELIAPGPAGEKKLTLPTRGWDLTGSADKGRYDMVCSLFNKFVEDADASVGLKNGTDVVNCRECKKLCYLVNSTIFGDAGSLTGGQEGDCDTFPDGPYGQHHCEGIKTASFKYWLDNNMDEDWDEESDFNRPFKIPKCDSCPGCKIK